MAKPIKTRYYHKTFGVRPQRQRATIKSCGDDLHGSSTATFYGASVTINEDNEITNRFFLQEAVFLWVKSVSQRAAYYLFRSDFLSEVSVSLRSAQANILWMFCTVPNTLRMSVGVTA